MKPVSHGDGTQEDGRFTMVGGRVLDESGRPLTRAEMKRLAQPASPRGKGEEE